MEQLTPLYVSGVLALGIAAQWLAWRFRLPAIVLLLAFGFAMGAVIGPPPEDEVIFPFVSLAVGVILFEGGLSLKIREVRATHGVVARLVTIGLLVTWLGGAVGARFLMGFSWSMSALLGALLTVSGPTVIVPLLRQVRPERRIGSVIKWEGIVNDPIGAVLAALVFEAIAHGESAGASAHNLVVTTTVGVAAGGLMAVAVIELLRHYLIPDYLQNVSILGLVVLTFAGANAMAAESGLIAVTVMGVILGNQTWASMRHVLEFKENLRVLLISVLFIVLSSRVEISATELGAFGWGGWAFIAGMILVVRPAAVALATLGSDLSRKERVLLAWVHPRGIVAAAVASLLAVQLPGDEGRLFVFATFMMIVGTVVVYGLTLGPLARRLGLSSASPQGVLFAGASPHVREIALALKNEGIQTLLVDTNSQNIAAARMAGLPVVYASIGSDFVHRDTDLGGLGRLLAMTPNDEINSIAAMEFAELFGAANVYQLASHEQRERHQHVPADRRGRTLFREGVTYDALAKRFQRGGVIKKTSISEDFTMDQFRKKYPDALILFTSEEKGKVRISVAGYKLEPKPGIKLIALVDPEPPSAQASAAQGESAPAGGPS